MNLVLILILLLNIFQRIYNQENQTTYGLKNNSSFNNETFFDNKTDIDYKTLDEDVEDVENVEDVEDVEYVDDVEDNNKNTTEEENKKELNEKNEKRNENGKENENNNYLNNFDSFLDSVLEKLKPDDYDEDNRMTIIKKVNHINDTFLIMKRFGGLIRKWFKLLKPFENRVTSKIIDMMYYVELSPECISGLVRTIHGISKRELWALKFIDSVGRLPSGLLNGVTSSFGEFDECLSIQSSQLRPEDELIYGKYCYMKPLLPHPPVGSYESGESLVQFDLIKNLYLGNQEIKTDQFVNNFIELTNYYNGSVFNFGIGICIPSTCNSYEIQELINYVVYPLAKIPVEIDDTECHVKDNNKVIKLDQYQIISIIILTTLTILTLASTVCHVYYNKISLNEHTDLRSLRDMSCVVNSLAGSFSLFTNYDKLKNYRNRFSCIDVIRFVTTLNIILFHYYNYANWFSRKDILNGLSFQWFTLNNWYYVLSRNYYVVDIHFCISGLLLTYSLFGKLERTNGQFSYIKYVIIRWSRFTPSLIGSILLYYLLPLVGDGPMWTEKNLDTYLYHCKYNLLSSIFYYNNFEIDMDHPIMCNGVSWWLSAAFQLYLIAPLFIYCLYHWPKVGYVLTTLGVLLGSYLSIIPRIYYGMLTLVEYKDYNYLIKQSFDALQTSHMSTYCHMSVFLFGILIGYLIKKKPNINFGGKYVEYLLWLVSSLFVYLSLYWTKTFWNDDTDNNSSINYVNLIIWTAFGRLLFISGFGYLFYMCSTGRSVVLNKIFSYFRDMFWPWGNMVLGIYLNHIIVLIYRILSTKHEYSLNNYNLLSFCFFDLLITLLIAYIFYFIIEAPFDNLVKLCEDLSQKNENKN